MILHTIAVSGQECSDIVTVGLLSYDNRIVRADHTVILADNAIPCSGSVISWEFCYQTVNLSLVTFYPGIWRITGTSGGYALVQSNTVTYNQSVRDPQDPVNNCQLFNLSDTDQFTVPAGSVVGLYSNMGPNLLHTNADNVITTYRFRGNQSNVNNAGNNDDVNYNVAIRVHLSEYSGICLCVFLLVHMCVLKVGGHYHFQLVLVF